MSSARATTLALVCALLLSACASILGIKAKSQERAFEHAAHVTRGVSCTTCHEGLDKKGNERELHLPSTARCVSCHQKPHDERACAGCHGSTHARERAALGQEHLRFDHARHLPRMKGQCVPCHSGAGGKDADGLRAPMAQCLACHAHKDQWRVRACDGCHVDLPKERVVPESHVVHSGDFVREHGVRAASARDLCATCHTEGFCAKCHGVTVPTLPWRLGFDRPSMSGLHRAGFRNRHADEARASPGLCSTCHAEQKFCVDCHQSERVGVGSGRNPHPPGWMAGVGGGHGRAARMDPGSCASCHGGSGEALCVGCHRVGGPGGNPHGPGFASALDVSRDEPCRRCHAQ